MAGDSKIGSRGSTVLLTTQYLEEADHLANRIALIDHGKMIAMGTPSELKQQIGGLQLRIEVTNFQRVEQAQKIVEDTLESPVVKDRTLTVQLDNQKIQGVSHVLSQLQDADMPLSYFSIETPSLDDVFMRMTVGKN